MVVCGLARVVVCSATSVVLGVCGCSGNSSTAGTDAHPPGRGDGEDVSIVKGADAGQTLAGLDLPPGWEQAVRVEVTQEALGLAGASAKPVVTVSPGTGSVSVQVVGALGRCDQQMVGWVRASADQLELLLQPSDMHPSAVGKCATAYDLKTTVPAPSGTLTVVVSLRSDAYAGEPNPTELARVSVSVP